MRSANRRRWLGAAAFTAVLTVAALGCGEAETSSSEGAASAVEVAEQAPQVKSDGRAPAEVVRIFLEGMQRGDQELVDSMLTAKARELDHFKVEARQGHRFAVGDTEPVGEEGARVASAWFYTEESPDGQMVEQTQKFIWVLKREAVGFRICGTFMILAELGGDAVSLDFENLAQMRKTEQDVQKRIMAAAGEEAAEAVAEKPGDSVTRRPQ